MSTPMDPRATAAAGASIQDLAEAARKNLLSRLDEHAAVTTANPNSEAATVLTVFADRWEVEIASLIDRTLRAAEKIQTAAQTAAKTDDDCANLAASMLSKIAS